MEANYQTKQKKWWKIILGTVIVLVLIAGGLYVYGIVTDDSPPNIYAAHFRQDLSSLTPGIRPWDKINCNDLENEKHQARIITGDVGLPISNEDYCLALEAIDRSDPNLCAGMKEFASTCDLIARWADIGSCVTDFNEIDSKNACIHNAVMSAYYQSKKDKEVWNWCLEIKYNISNSENDSFNYQTFCLAGAAFHERDTSICSNLPDKDEIKDCEQAAKWWIEKKSK